MSRQKRKFPTLPRDHGEIRAEVDEEIRFHLDLRRRELEARGYPPAAAEAEALRRFGDLEATRQTCFRRGARRERRRAWSESLADVARDLRLALRQLRRRPAFCAVAVTTLALGIGAATAVWSAVDHLLLRPLPYREAARIVTLWETDPSTGGGLREVSPGSYFDWRERSRSFAAIALADPYGYDLTGDGPPEPLQAWRVTEEWFEALGAVPLHGRGFLPEEFSAPPGRPAAAVVSHRLWQTRWGGDPGLLGRRIELDGEAVEVVGVLPPGLAYPEPRDLWTPKVFQVTPRWDERAERGSAYMRVVARLRPEIDLEAARQELNALGAALAREHPASHAGVGIAAVPLRERLVGEVRPALLVLLGAVGLLLLIACANVAGLLLARASERGRELAVRAALGASRARLARQALGEALILATAGGAAGAAAAWAAVRILAAVAPPELPRLAEIAVDGRILAVAAGLSLVAALLCAAAPALRPGGARELACRELGSRSAAVPRLRGALVVAQVAVGLVLLVGAGLLARSFARLTANDLGFTVERRAALQLFLWDRHRSPPQRVQAVAALGDRLAALPGVEEVAVASTLPFHSNPIDATDELVLIGRPAPPGMRHVVHTTIASPGLFRMLGMPLLAGRPFTDGDRGDAPAVALVNRALAERFFPGEDAVGRRVRVGAMGPPVEREIVGVVGDVRPTALDSEPRPELYVPFAQSATGSVTFVVATAGDPGRLLAALREAVWEVDPGQAVYHSATLEGMVSATLAARRFQLFLVAAFSMAALGLATVGTYGLVGFLARQRTSEIGVRLVLGASRPRLIAAVVASGLRLGLAGVALGVAGALLATRALRPLLYGVEPTDPTTFVAIALLVVTVCAVAAYFPARAAATADPLRALRSE